MPPEQARRPNSTAAQSPQHTALFTDIASYALTLRPSSNPTPNGDHPPPKKRKLDDNAGSINGTSSSSAEWHPGYHTVPDTSFLIPQRKKLTLEISPRADEGLRARNASTGAVEFGVAWRDVHDVVCVPVPEKAQRQFAFCVFPAYGDDGTGSVAVGAAAKERLVWTVLDAVPKNVSLSLALARDGEGARGGSGSYKDYVRGLLDVGLGGAVVAGRKVVEPEEREFASALVHAHRKGERAFHVSAFRGSKDGACVRTPRAREVVVALYALLLSLSLSRPSSRDKPPPFVTDATPRFHPAQASSSSSQPASCTPSKNPSSSSPSTPSPPSPTLPSSSAPSTSTSPPSPRARPRPREPDPTQRMARSSSSSRCLIRRISRV